jgi:hypothetical protein
MDLFDNVEISADDDATQIKPKSLSDDPDASDNKLVEAVEQKTGLPLGELLAIVAAALTIVGMCILLWRFDNKIAPSWSYNPRGNSNSRFGAFFASRHITINSILSLFSTVTEILLAYLLTKSLTKSTWLWFMGNEDRNLADMTVFYKVAKKSWKGAVSLIRLVKWRYELKS